MQAITSAIVINVGGKQFYTTMSTLNKSPFFEAMFRGSDTLEGNAERQSKSLSPVIPFIDRDPGAFKHILSLLRDPTYPFPKGLEHELNFYGMSQTTTNITDTFTAGEKPESEKPESEKYMLLSDFVKLSPEARFAYNGPIQVVPMKKAMVGKRIYREIGEVHVSCMLTLESWNDLYTCGIAKEPREKDIGKSTFAFTIVSDTSIYFQEPAGHVSKIERDALFKYVATSLLVPVLKESRKTDCIALYITPCHSLDQFQ